jgi:uncharacterized membrane protein
MQPAPPVPTHVDNNMVLSVVALFLFWPIAIPAVMNAVKVNRLVAKGDQPGAQEAALRARKFATVAVAAGLVFWVAFCGVTGCGPLGSTG